MREMNLSETVFAEADRDRAGPAAFSLAEELKLGPSGDRHGFCWPNLV